MDSVSRRYDERELGAGMGPAMFGDETLFGYTEPLRRLVQRDSFTPQANEIPNTAASWLPGEDYYTNFHKGDPPRSTMASRDSQEPATPPSIQN